MRNAPSTGLPPTTSSSSSPTHLATPTVAFAYNSLPPGQDQPPHRHNAAALTLCVQGEGVYSKVDERKVDWQDRAVMVTPPSALHSHHNRGPDMMYSVVAQDGAEPSRAIRRPVRYDGEREPAADPAPRLGQHNHRVLADAGFGAAEVAELTGGWGCPAASRSRVASTGRILVNLESNTGTYPSTSIG